MKHGFDLSRSPISDLIDERRYLDGICFEPLAEEFELSVRQVKNIVYRSENKLLKRFKV